jgi:type I restriction enzyme S subunit
MVRVTDVQGGFLDLSKSLHVSDEVFQEFTRRYAPKKGDMVFSRVGSYGNVSYARTDTPFCLGQNTALISPRINGRFLHLFLQSAEARRQIEQVVVGSTQKTISLKSISALQIPIPPPDELEAIAAVLGALDDKIELNRRMNATLEAMARALFQSWFVDFDPVRAKLDGRQPVGLGPDTAALFPNSFEDSPLGHIPLGWESSTIGAKLQTVLGGTPSRAQPEFWEDGTVAWINSGKTNEFRIIAPSEWITKEALENSATKLFPRRTTVLAITGATLGQVSVSEIECCANQSVVAILSSEHLPTEFIYLWIKEHIEKLIASQTGGAQQHINKGNVEELALLWPDRRILAAYRVKATPLFDQIAAYCFQSCTLATLRDTLLPKLLSGELRAVGENCLPKKHQQTRNLIRNARRHVQD